MFHDKLTLLMNLQGISNRDLAGALHIDASLVSRWRTGNRLPTQNSPYLQDISHFFANNSSQPYQKVALLAAMGVPTENIPNNNAVLSQHIYSWLIQSFPEEGAGHATNHLVGSLLGQMDTANACAFMHAMHSPQEIPAGIAAANEVYHGFEGLRNAWLRLLNKIVGERKVTEIYLYSDQNLEWINCDPDYDRQWCSLLMQCVEHGARVHVIQAINRPAQELFPTFERWLPFLISGKADYYYCPSAMDTLFRRSLAVAPGAGSIVSHCLAGTEKTAEVYLQLDDSRTDFLLGQFREFLSLCQPLMQFFTSKSMRQYHKKHLDFVCDPSDNISVISYPSTVTMPEELFLAGLKRMKIPSTNRIEALKLFRVKADIFQRGLYANKYTEILNLPPPEQLRPQELHMNYATYFGMQSLCYTEDDFRAHIQNIIRLLKQYDNYSLLLKNNSRFSSLQLMTKATSGIIFNKDYDPYLTFILTQPNIVQSVYYYLENVINDTPLYERSKQHVIQQLNRYLDGQ